MIIDVLKNMKNSITVSYMDSGSEKIDSGSSLFSQNDSFKWEITNPIKDNEDQFIQVTFDDVINIKNISYSFTANNSSIPVLQHSCDDKTFMDFNYISYTIQDDSVSDVIKWYENRLIRIEKYYVDTNFIVDGYVDNYFITSGDMKALYVIYNENNKDIDVSSIEYATLFKTEFESSINKLNIKYVFSVTNGYTKDEEYLYTDLNPKSIRLKLTNFSTPFILNKFEIYADQYINDVEPSLSLLSDNFFKPKYFQDNNFIPSISKTFFDMLEGK